MTFNFKLILAVIGLVKEKLCTILLVLVLLLYHAMKAK